MAKGGKRVGSGRKPGKRNPMSVTIQKKALTYCPEALDRLRYLMNHAESETAQVSAANSILDRGIGKAVQPFASLTNEEIEKMDLPALDAIISGGR